MLSCPVFPVSEPGPGSLSAGEEDPERDERAEGGDRGEERERCDLLPDRNAGRADRGADGDGQWGVPGVEGGQGEFEEAPPTSAAF